MAPLRLFLSASWDSMNLERMAGSSAARSGSAKQGTAEKKKNRTRQQTDLFLILADIF